MSNVKNAILQLIEHIQLAPTDAKRCVQPLESEITFPLLDWLDAQPHFPKFYWQSRDSDEEVVALGQIYTFLDPAPAYQVIAPGQRVWGGQSFDGRTSKNPRCMSSFFFLPQIELLRKGNDWCLAANLTQDKQRIIEALQRLVCKVQPIPSINVQIKQRRNTPSYPQWSALISKVLVGIEKGSVEKVVLARETHLSLSHELRPAQLLKASTACNHNSFHFLLAMDSKHAFMGSTPERLYVRYGRTLITEALAGTIGRSDDLEADEALSQWLLADEKNRVENQFVVDDIVDRISPLASSIQVQQQASLVKLRKVQHLRRCIEATLLPNVNGVQLLAALQPTAAVAGLPRNEAKTFIAENEPFARGWYAGSVGYISHEQAQFCVAIRSALVNGSEVKLYAGAGIVNGSEAESEWQELDRKVSTLLSLIAEPQSLGVAS